MPGSRCERAGGNRNACAGEGRWLKALVVAANQADCSATGSGAIHTPPIVDFVLARSTKPCR